MNQIREKIEAAAKLFDVPAGWMLAMAWVESRMQVEAFNKTSHAKGLFQFIPLTAEEYGINPFDLTEACAAAAMMARRNMVKLAAACVGPTLTTTYLAHQQGAKGCIEIVRAGQGAGALGHIRIRNMRANIYQGALPEGPGDKELATRFVQWWTGRLGQAEVEARKATGG